MRRSDDYEASLRRRKPTAAEQTEGLGLFQSTTTTDDDAEQLRARLVRLAQELATKAGAHGVTVGDVRIHATNQGLFTEQESKQRIAALRLETLMRDAGLFVTEQFRRSDVARSNGNPHRVWVVREFAPIDQRKEA